MRLQLGVKEWAGVVKSAGSGDQLIIVRRYDPRAKELFYYPTFNYYNSEKNNRESFDEKFQSAFRDSAWEAGKLALERGQKECLVDVDYWAEVKHIVSIDEKFSWKKLKDFYIWSPEHVEKYAQGSRTGSVLLWVMRTYKFPKTVVLGRIAQGGPPDFYKAQIEIDTAGSKPVLSEDEFKTKESAILKATEGQKKLGEAK